MTLLITVVYTIEFQKRGLPHAHILLFLHSDDKIRSQDKIDKFISAEIPNESTDPVLFDVVKKHMIHGPCGVANINSPCMVEGKCSKHFPKNFNERTLLDEDGYPKYKRRDNGSIIEKNRIPLDNRYVVPFNAWLLKKYHAHINVEYCNQGRAIKYLFKYINKGHDRITAAFHRRNANGERIEDTDEIKIYYDCR